MANSLNAKLVTMVDRYGQVYPEISYDSRNVILSNLINEEYQMRHTLHGCRCLPTSLPLLSGISEYLIPESSSRIVT